MSCYNVSPRHTTRLSQLIFSLHYLDYKRLQFPEIYFCFFVPVDLKLSSADKRAGPMFEMNDALAKDKKSSLKVATPSDEKISTLEIHESHRVKMSTD